MVKLEQLERKSTDYQADCCFAMTNEKKQLLGTICLKHISDYNRNAECVYIFDKSVISNKDLEAGLKEDLIEAVLQIRSYAFKELALAEIYMRIFEDDEQMTASLTANGFKKGGTYVGMHEQQGEYRNLCWYYSKNSEVKVNKESNVIRFQEKGDHRGHLVIIEQLADIPFEIKRIFYIYGSDREVVRGRHANRRSEFVLVNVAGTSKVKVFDGVTEKIYVLDQPHMGVYLPKMVWKEMYDFSPDSVLLVISNELYDAKEYIRDYNEYLRILAAEK